MIAIVCVDEKMGMLFHQRRQSQDRVLREDILQSCQGRILYMNAYSYKLFGGKGDGTGGCEIRVAEDFMALAGAGDYCFVENVDLAPWESELEGAVMYQWNRRYPADVYFPLNLADGSWERLEEAEFKGSSHDRITKTVFGRKENR